MSDKPQMNSNFNNHINNSDEVSKIAKEVALVVAETAKSLAVETSKQSSLTMSTMALMGQNIDFIKGEISEIKSNIDHKYTTKEEHASLKEKVSNIENSGSWLIKIVIGTVVLALLSLVIMKKSI